MHEFLRDLAVRNDLINIVSETLDLLLRQCAADFVITDMFYFHK